MGNAVSSDDVIRCETAVETVTSAWYLTVLSIICISSVCASLMSAIFLFSYHKKMVFHSNVKILLRFFAALCFLYSVSFAIVGINTLVNIIFRDENCKVLYLTSQCSAHRRLQLTSFVGFTTVQCALLFERTIATAQRQSYEKRGTFTGFVAAISAEWDQSWRNPSPFFQDAMRKMVHRIFCIVAVLLVFWALWFEDPNFPQTNCSGFSNDPSVADRIYALFYGIIVLDAIQLVLFLVLCKFNKVRTKVTDSLCVKFQRNENFGVMSSIGPVILLKILVVSAYIISVLTVRKFKDQLGDYHYKNIVYTIYIIPHYTLLMNIVLFIVVKKAAKKQQMYIKKISKEFGPGQSDMYFNGYKW